MGFIGFFGKTTHFLEAILEKKNGSMVYLENILETQA